VNYAKRAGAIFALRRLIVPVILVLPLFGSLLHLSHWQYQRLGWKTDLIHQIAKSEGAPPVAFTNNPGRFTKIFLNGIFDYSRESLLELEVRNSVLGARLLTPLILQDGKSVLVDRGWVPIQRDMSISRPDGTLQVEGYVRPSDQRNRFSAADDVARRRFFTFDAEAIGTALGLNEVSPFGVVALGPNSGYPDPVRRLPRPTNNHLGYAITWFGLALSLAAVFAAWARRRLRENS